MLHYKLWSQFLDSRALYFGFLTYTCSAARKRVPERLRYDPGHSKLFTQRIQRLHHRNVMAGILFNPAF